MTAPAGSLWCNPPRGQAATLLAQGALKDPWAALAAAHRGAAATLVEMALNCRTVLAAGRAEAPRRAAAILAGALAAVRAQARRHKYNDKFQITNVKSNPKSNRETV